jgi:hypothetical protein
MWLDALSLSDGESKQGSVCNGRFQLSACTFGLK